MTFEISRREWDRHNPRPEHPQHGPVVCPDIILWKLVDVVPQCCPDRCARCAPLRVQVASLHAWAPWEAAGFKDNEDHWREAESMVAALNAGWASLYSGERAVEN